MKTTIYVASHKEFWRPKYIEYKVIQVGAANAAVDEKFADVQDDKGIAISEKNKNFCELTGLYWIWKNDIVSDYIGLCHYRRYFVFKKTDKRLIQMTTDRKFAEYIDGFIDPEIVEAYFKDYDVILPTPAGLHTKSNLQETYYKAHGKQSFDVMKTVLVRLYPEYENSLEHVIKRKYQYLYNMMITKKEIFNDYVKWLFDILFEVEKTIEIPNDIYQSRVFGFLAERLLNIYVYHNCLRIKELPVVNIDEEITERKYQYKNIGYLIKRRLIK